MLSNCEFDPDAQTSVKFESKYNNWENARSSVAYKISAILLIPRKFSHATAYGTWTQTDHIHRPVYTTVKLATRQPHTKAITIKDIPIHNPCENRLRQTLYYFVRAWNFWQSVVPSENVHTVRQYGCFTLHRISEGFGHWKISYCNIIWVRSRNCDCLVTWFCYQLVAKPGNNTATVRWPDLYTFFYCIASSWCTM